MLVIEFKIKPRFKHKITCIDGKDIPDAMHLFHETDDIDMAENRVIELLINSPEFFTLYMHGAISIKIHKVTELEFVKDFSKHFRPLEGGLH